MKLPMKLNTERLTELRQIYRDELFEVDDDGSKNFVDKISSSIKKRTYGKAVKILCTAEMPEPISNL